MTVWQVSSKREVGDYLELEEFPSLWRAVLWLILHMSRRRVAVIIRIEE